MTKDQLRIPTWAIPLLIGVIATGAVAQYRLSGKEDSTAHSADVVQLQSAIKDVRTDAEKKAIRDSASRAELRSMLRDLACPKYPTRDYCR